ncbi:MAG: hypothetical protein H6830_04510 [Planctomycetes bacterium]|nr:hypothetical protein [Planctomycetota bacterium]MCB9910498.1 hypothetical protein [Planctomycetota bacterium]MCB9912624.1 hypothetical protein [Planctomycetota bacterium]HRV80248.1 hypothetical protein [Planctomycetota bacterium]
MKGLFKTMRFVRWLYWSDKGPSIAVIEVKTGILRRKAQIYRVVGPHSAWRYAQTADVLPRPWARILDAQWFLQEDRHRKNWGLSDRD